jgi:hypothetical protein
MKLGPWKCLIGFFVLASHSVLHADEQSNREILRAEVIYLLEAGDEQSALSTLGDYLREFKYDAEGWRLLGLTYVRIGEVGKGERSLRRAAQLSTKSVDRDRAQSALKEASRASSAKKWNGELGLDLGYDSNVLLASRDSLSSGTASKVGSPKAMPSVWIRRRFQLTQGELSAGLYSSFEAYTTKNSKPYNALTVVSPIEFWFEPNGNFQKGIVSSFDISYLNSSGLEFFSWGESVAFEGRLEHADGARSSASAGSGYRKYAVQDGADPTADRSGVPATLAVSHARNLGEFTLRAALEYEYSHSNGSLFRTHELVVPLKLSFPSGWLGGELSLLLEGIYTRYPTTNLNRKDRIADAELEYQHELSKRFRVVGTYQFRRAFSNVSDADYTRHTALLGGRYALF